MKRLILLLMLAACAAAWAQDAIQLGGETKRINMISAERGVILQETSDGIIALVPDTKKKVMCPVTEKGDWHLGLWGFDGKPIKEVVAPRKEAGECFSRIVDDKLYVLYPSGPGMMRLVVNPKTLEIISKGEINGVSVYVNSDAEREVDAMFKIATTTECAVSASPNGDFYVIANRHSITKMIALLDETFEPLWVRKDLVDVSSFVRVDNEGVVYMIHALADAKSHASRIKFLRLDVEDETEKVIDLPYELRDLSLLNVIDGRIVALGLVATDLASNQTEKRRTCDRLIGMVYDFNKKTFSKDIQNISSDALNVFGNLGTGKTNPIGKADMLSITLGQPTSYGGVGILQRGWGKEEYNRDFGITYYSYVVSGQVMVSVGVDGTIKWQRPFRQYMEEKNFREQSRTLPLLITEGEDSYFIIPQERISKTGYDIASPIPANKIPGRAFYTAIFRVDASGNVTVKSAPKSSQNLLDSPIRTKDGRYLSFYSSPNKGGFAYFQL